MFMCSSVRVYNNDIKINNMKKNKNKTSREEWDDIGKKIPRIVANPVYNKICKECGASDSQIEVDYAEYQKIKEKFNLVGFDDDDKEKLDIFDLLNIDSKNLTNKQLRRAILFAKREIEEFEDFIKLCEKKIKENRLKK